MELPALRSFLSGYLHQDWDLEYGDSSEAAADFAGSESPELVKQVVADLDELLATDASDEALLEELDELGSSYQPTGSTREWLQELRGAMVPAARD